MRAVIYALMTMLWFTATPGQARNGETGILIMIQNFEFVADEQEHTTSLLLCSQDLERITRFVEEGYVTSIFLPGYGVYEVDSTPEGAISLYKNNIEIQSRECQINAHPHC